MYTRIVLYKDKENFGNTVVVYKSSSNYLVIIKDRDEVSYYFLDKDINMMYPMNTYMKQIDFEYSFENIDNQIDRFFDVDLSTYGHSICPEYLKKLITDSLTIKKKVSKKETFFEMIKELSIIPLFFIVLTLILAVTFIFPKEFLEKMAFEEQVFAGIVVILAVLYLVAGIIAIVKKVVAKHKGKREE